MSKGYFIAGTDTGVGKTQISVGLIHALRQQGLSVAGMKPVASGCVETESGLRNDDALQLQAAASREHPYDDINPYAFAPPIAPHIAAQQVGRSISLQVIEERLHRLQASAECVVVEGVGGWQVPLDQEQTMAQLAQQLGFPVILVVGLRLGCLNHALLSHDAILESGLNCAGWIANQVDPHMEYVSENIDYLQRHLRAPLLGSVPCLSSPDAGQVSHAIHLECL